MPIRSLPARVLLAALFTCLAPSATAQDTLDDVRPHERSILASHTYLAAHPDLRWRRRGLEELRKGNPEEAFTYFRRAARYADKPSQAMVAEMLWTGWGVEADRSLAYAWMDLAAERAWLPFVAKREEYWNALDAAGRERALAAGPDIYLQYGDFAAKPRLEFKLRFGKPRRGGLRSAWEIHIPGVAGSATRVDGRHFWDDRYWEPDAYWQWQDDIWRAPRKGQVDVNALEVVEDTPE